MSFSLPISVLLSCHREFNYRVGKKERRKPVFEDQDALNGTHVHSCVGTVESRSECVIFISIS